MSETSESVTTSPWQSKLSSPAERLASLYKTSKLTDLTITFTGHEDTIQSHRWVLAMSSPVFEAMLFGPMAEKKKLNLPGDPPEAFRWLLEYMYCGSTELSTVKLAVKVYHLANKYQMDALVCLCSQFLQSKLDANNLPEIYDTALLYEDTCLLHNCTQILNHSASAVLSSPNLGQLSKNSLQHILQQDFFISHEYIIFNSIISWGASQRIRCREGDGSLREVLEEFLPQVRFLTMTVDEVVEHVMPSGILTPQETCTILMSIKKILNVSLPALFSSTRKMRLHLDESILSSLRINIPISHCYSEGFGCNSEMQTIASEIKVSDTIILKKIASTGKIFKNINQTIASEIKVSDTIYLKKIASTGKIFKNGSKVTIMDDDNHVLATTNVLGYEAKFEMPVILTSKAKYNLRCNNISITNNSTTFSGSSHKLTLTGKFKYGLDLTLFYWSF